MKRSFAVLGCLGALLLVACAGATTGTSGGTSADGGSSGSANTSCSELADGARQEVDAVLQAHRSCTQASDCVAVSLSASCFDSCGRAIRIDGAAAYKAAQDKVNAAQCAQFATQGCKLIVPPCAPPSVLACVDGKCTN